MTIAGRFIDYLVQLDETLDRFRTQDEPSAPFRTIHFVAVRKADNGAHIALYGADPADFERVLAQTEKRYPVGQYIHSTCTQPISRTVADTWENRPPDDAPAQTWAEFLYQ